MARDTGSYTRSNPPVTDPVQSLAATASNDTSAALITYTTASAHNLAVGQPVITSGFSNAWLNYNPDSGVGAGTPAIVASVTSSTVFTVKTPAAFSTSSSSVAGTVLQQALVSGSPYGDTWLPTTAQTNVVIAREWGNSFPIQPNDDRAANTALASSAPAGNGTQVTYTVSSHSFVAGQQVSIQGVVPDVYNLENVTVAAITSTTVVVNSTITAPVTSYTGGSIVAVSRLNGTFPAITSAIGATGVTGVTKTTPAAVATGATSVGVNNTTGIVVGGSISATGIAANTVITAVVGTNAVTINPATTGAVASAATLTIGSGLVNLYTTGQAHGLTAGQNVTVLGASVAPYNTSGIVQNATATTFSVKAPTFKITKVSGTNGSGVVGDGSNVLYYTDSAHGLAAGDTVNISGMAPAAYNFVNATVVAPVTANTFAVATNASATVTATGYGLKNSGSFSGTAKVSVEDSSWSASYVTPSGNLVAALDNHDRVVNSERGYPDFTPSYTIPDVRGFTTTNAIQKIRAAGLQPGNIDFGVNTTGTASSNNTTVTVASTTGIYVGQTVTGTAAVTTAIVATNYVASIGSGTVTLNATTAAAITATAPITFITDMVGTSISTTANTVTITVPNAAHYFAVGDTVTLSNSGNTSLKGDWTVAAVPTAATFTLNIAGVTGTASGVIIRAKNTGVQNYFVTASAPQAVNLIRNYGS